MQTEVEQYTWLDAPYYHRYWNKFELSDIVHGLRASVLIYPITSTDGKVDPICGRLEYADCVSRKGGRDAMLEAILKRKIKAEWERMDDQRPMDVKEPVAESVQALEHRILSLESTIADMKAKYAKECDLSVSSIKHIPSPEITDLQHRMLDNLLRAIVAMKARFPEEEVYARSVFQEMIAAKGFQSDCGMTFLEIVNLAEQRSLVEVDYNDGEIDLKWW